MTWLRNRVGCAYEEVALPSGISTVSQLLDWMQERNDRYRQAFSERSLIYCSNGSQICALTEPVNDDSELTFFSPIVGG